VIAKLHFKVSATDAVARPRPLCDSWASCIIFNAHTVQIFQMSLMTSDSLANGTTSWQLIWLVYAMVQTCLKGTTA